MDMSAIHARYLEATRNPPPVQDYEIRQVAVAMGITREDVLRMMRLVGIPGPSARVCRG